MGGVYAHEALEAIFFFCALRIHGTDIIFLHIHTTCTLLNGEDGWIGGVLVSCCAEGGMSACVLLRHERVSSCLDA